MKSWAQLVADTVRMGGVLVFINDQAPRELPQWLEPLRTAFSMKIPTITRSKVDLERGRYQTGAHDLIFFFEGQESVLKDLNAFVQGQRVWITPSKVGPIHVDYVWHDTDLSVWKAFWAFLEPQFESLIENWENEDADFAPCLFLDRDDVVVKNIPYNKDPEQVELIPAAVELMREAHAQGFWVALVTNQSGIGRGRISWSEYKSVHQRMLKLLADQGVWIDECVWASYIGNEGVQAGRVLAGLRKPRAGMFQLVRDKLKVDMKSSIMVGDSATDLIAAFAAGVGRCYLFESDKSEQEKKALTEFSASHPEFWYQAISAAADISLGRL